MFNVDKQLNSTVTVITLLYVMFSKMLHTVCVEKEKISYLFFQILMISFVKLLA